MVWSTLPDGLHDYFNARWYEFTGVPPGTTDGEGWNDMFHPEDRERAWEVWRRSLDTGGAYEIEYRLRHHSGDYRWTLGRALPMRDEAGNIIRWMGTCTDIHDTKMQAEQIALLSRELSHRIKNIFAVVGSLIRLSARGTPEHKEFAETVQERVSALARAHEMVRPHSDASRPELPLGTLRDMLCEILAPYPALEDGRLSLAGDDVAVADSAATPIALLVHELATNASKYGALSVPKGRVSISIAITGKLLSLTWEETNGPALHAPPGSTGFGTVLTGLSVRDQLGGTLEREWRPEGLKVTAIIPTKAVRGF
jgi:PAS domain S-box-containing protein